MNGAEETARRRYLAMNAVRIGGIAVLLVGLAMARQVIPGPWSLGAALAVAGLLAFFFLPTLMVRRWKRAERER
ncbi:hypothetical protein [Erythrobacter sp. HL-111]|uniref:hypothetical protein n=1 Tax=Erythrobacter sp. HL-111 TaxID=1798193 RepID=UPI0006DA3689|nr:hypothetical protein [Erythrobacter sp. HL-111]KPP88102.1 MAG: putative cobalt transporter subunit (CbtA) [Erythrobacteraceae bacterium HL-111]SDT09170.1 hypothetical protein SAMN04515621_2890 [Erythrobacter sp. HL-111]